ncbi:MAG: hypothetical protein ACD_10C00727G0005 [uncultured bacterium]|nr:MAG: hypothetical protein ACD_10C00727G0005 [uncultured bacterium]
MGKNAGYQVQFFGCFVALRNVETGAEVADEFAIDVVKRPADIEQPAICPIVPTQAVFHRERLAIFEGAVVGFQALLQIVRVYAFRPAIAGFLGECPTGEFEPGPVEIITFGIQPGSPDGGGEFLQHR